MGDIFLKSWPAFYCLGEESQAVAAEQIEKSGIAHIVCETTCPSLHSKITTCTPTKTSNVAPSIWLHHLQAL